MKAFWKTNIRIVFRVTQSLGGKIGFAVSNVLHCGWVWNENKILFFNCIHFTATKQMKG